MATGRKLTSGIGVGRHGSLPARCLLIAGGVLLLPLIGCGSATAPTTVPAPTTARAATPMAAPISTPTPVVRRAPTGKLVVAAGALSVDNLDPQNQPGSDKQSLSRHAFLLIIDRRPGREDYFPSAVERWEVKPEGWTFYVRKGMKHHDGQPVTAADFKYSMERATNPTLRWQDAGPLIDMVEKVDIIDEYTFFAKTKGPIPILDTGALYRLPIVPKHIFEPLGDKIKTATSIVGNGMFRLPRLEAGVGYTLEAYEEFWDATQVPRVKQIDFAYMPEPATRVAALKAGQVDIVSGPPSAEAKAAQEGQTRDIKVRVTPMAAHYELYIDDLAKPAPSPLKDKRVRLAMELALDRQSIITNVLRGFGQIAPTGPTWPYDPSWDPSEKPRPYDPTQAAELLRQAGYGGGFKTTLNAAPAAKDMAEAMQAIWAKVNINVGINLDTNLLQNFIDNKNVGLTYGLSNPARGDVISSYRRFMGTGGYLTKVSDPALDELFARANNELDRGTRGAVGKQILAYIKDNNYAILQWYASTVHLTGPRVASWPVIPYFFWDVGLQYAELAPGR